MSLQSDESARQAFDQAVGLIQANAFASADATLSAALEITPNDPNLLRLLGISLSKQKRFVEAEEKLTHVIRLLPDLAQAYEDLADAQLGQGRVEEALESLRKTVKYDPNASRAAQRLGELLTVLGRGNEAEEVFTRSLQHSPERQALAEAMELVRQGESPKAEKIYRDLLRRDPENVDALRLLGVLCVKTERMDDAAAFFRRAVELAPDFWKAWINLGTAMSEQQKFDQAEDAYRHALAIQPNSTHTLERLGANCMKAGHLDESIAWLEKALEIDAQHFPSLLCLGHALKTVGQQDEAIAAYRRCAEAKPDFGEVYWSLANLKTFRFTEAEVDVMGDHLDAMAESPDGEDGEIAFSFALGKAYEDRADYTRAFDYYSRGNSKKRLKVNYDPIEFQRNNDRVIEVFSSEFFAAREGSGCEDDSPILIVGLPRSGSTLLEQILASHSQVEGTAELHYLLRSATESGLNRNDGVRYPQVMHELQAHHMRGLGEEYIENTQKHRTGARYFTDKMPNNFSAIGYLHTILPYARVIDARRHPLDSCLGTFKQLFANGQVFSYDLYDLAHYYIEYMRMMDHWNAVLPGKVLTVNYESVVDDLEGQARAIAAHCGLGWEDQMLEFHRTQRAVKTASSEQVRQPIYKSAVATWRRYEDELEELIDYLEPVLMRLPAEARPKSLREALPV